MQQKGFTLIEALIALFVLAIGILGVAAMQISSMQSAHSSYQRSFATLAATDFVERVWMEVLGSENISTCPTVTSLNSAFSSWQTDWNAAGLLPGLDSSSLGSSLDCQYELSVTWIDERFSLLESGEVSFLYVVSIPEFGR